MDERILCINRTYDFKKSNIDSELFVLDDSNYNYNYTKKFPNNDILLLPNKMQCDILNFNRSEIENNNEYQQLIVGLVIKSNDDLLVLECIDGDMVGYNTMIEGHVIYDEKEKNTLLNTILYENILREFNEEIVVNFSKIDEKDIGAFYNLHLKYIAWNNTNKNNISYRHIGFIYELDISDTKYPLSKTIFREGEPSKNKIKFINLNKINKDNFDMFCSWTKELIVYYQFKKDHKY